MSFAAVFSNLDATLEIYELISKSIATELNARAWHHVLIERGPSAI
jgi:hypothetical protein